jgi:hypothetical protein
MEYERFGMDRIFIQEIIIYLRHLNGSKKKCHGFPWMASYGWEENSLSKLLVVLRKKSRLIKNGKKYNIWYLMHLMKIFILSKESITLKNTLESIHFTN